MNYFIIKCMLAVISLVPVSASSLLQVEEMEGLGGALFLRGNRGVQRCPSTLSNHAQSVGQLRTFICANIFSLKNMHDEFHLVCFCVIWVPDSAVEGVSSSSSTKDIGSSSPLTDRKKHRRKKSMNQKGDANIGQADGKPHKPLM